jgi:hypothetical protein
VVTTSATDNDDDDIDYVTTDLDSTNHFQLMTFPEITQTSTTLPEITQTSTTFPEITQHHYLWLT